MNLEPAYRIAFAHPRMERGGSESSVMWGLEALRGHGRLTLLTTNRVDIGALNACFGTRVNAADIEVRRPRWPAWLRRAPAAAALRGALYQRFCRREASRFDVLISGYNLCDFGRPAIHRIADFSWDEAIRARLHPAPPGAAGLFHTRGLPRRLYRRVCAAFAAPSGRNLFAGEDLIIANSEWTAALLRECHGLTAPVIYPPVPVVDGPLTPWEERDNGFVCLGRIAPEKRIERIIAILRRVRAQGHDVHLHVIGALDGSPYARRVRQVGERESAWVTLEGPRFGREKTALLARHRFGLHACEGEAFGIAVAEMVQAGCIVFAPREGGQSEIIRHADLLYADDDAAVAQIVRALAAPDRHAEWRRHLAEQADRFSVKTYMRAFREAVLAFAARARPAAMP